MEAISIIVPVFNVENNLNILLDSLVNQTYKNIEILLINDGSDDSSGEICDEFAKNDSRVKVFHRENSGVSTSRNVGISESTSNYIMFIDSDDLVNEQIVELLYEEITHEDHDLVICGYKRVFKSKDNIDNVNEILPVTFSGSMKEYLCSTNEYIETPILQGPCWKLFKKSIIVDNNIEFPLEMSYGEDTYFVYRYLRYVKKISFIRYALYYYINRDTDSLSTTFRSDKYLISLFLVEEFKKMSSFHNMKLDEDVISKQISSYFISYIGEVVNSRNRISKEEKRICIAEAIALEETINSFKQLSNNSIQVKILSKWIQKKKIRSINFYFMLKEFIRFKIRPLYSIITKMLA